MWLLAGCDAPRIDIPRQALDSALVEWGRQTGYSVFVPLCAGDQLTPTRVKSEDAFVALKRLLSATNLTYYWVDPLSVRILCPGENPPPPGIQQEKEHSTP
jgi:hypothetical protein